MKKVLSIYRKYSNKKIRLISFLFCVTSTITPVLSVSFFKSVLSGFDEKEEAWRILLLAVVYFSVSFLGPAVSQILEKNLSEFRLANIATEYFNTILKLRVSQINDPSVLKKVKDGESFSAQSWKGYQRLMKLIPTLCANIFTLCLLGALNDFFVVIIIMAFIAAASTSFGRRNSVYEKEIDSTIIQQKYYTSFYSNILGDSELLREIKVSKYEKFIKQRLLSRTEATQNSVDKILKEYCTKITGVSFLSSLPYLIAVLYLTMLIATLRIDISTGIVYVSLIKTVQDILKGIVKNTEKVRADISLYEEYCVFLALSDNMNEGKKSALPQTENMSIEFSNVSYRYTSDGPYALRNFSYRFEPGKRIAVVGESGAGKTTIVKLLCGFIKPTEGKVMVNGVDLSDISLEEYQRCITTVFQHSDLLAFRLEESMPNNSHNARVLGELVDRVGMRELIRKLPQGIESHYTKKIFDDGVNLSGGELQMFVLLRALLKPAALYILDEPTSAMDVNNEAKTITSFLSVTEKKTAVIVTHRLLITKFCDEIVVLQNGELVESGTHECLVKAEGCYAGMYKVQSEGYK